jgi:two-component system response regulator
MSTQGVELLLADDNPVDVELILLSLAAEGIAGGIQHVHDGEEALEFLFCRGAFTQRPFDILPKLVILDVKLPKVSGLEVLQEIRQDPRTRLVPVVLLTSSNLARDVARGYQLGANSYVQKPVDFVQFRHTVQRLGMYWLQVNEPPPSSHSESKAP